MNVAAPMYFGPAARARFGLLHWPTGPVRGGAVVCPPLGYEDVCAHTALRRLAERLASAGIATLRIDYDGTGNSMGRVTDPDRVGAWSATVDDAVREFARWQIPSVTLIGLRFGATMAAAARSGVEAAVLWDPIFSGRRYGRALRMLAARDQGAGEPSGGVSVAGVWFSDSTLDAIGAVALDPSQIVVPSLVVVRPQHARDADSWRTSDNPLVDARVRDGMAQLVDVDAELATVPEAVVDEICDWLVDRTRDRPDAPTNRRLLAPPVLADSAQEPIDEDSLVHRARRLTPSGLFLIDTTRVQTSPSHALVTLNNGVARSIGPGGAWVELAHRAAVAGWRVVRLDISGIGDSPARPGAAENDSYPLTAAEDVGGVIADLRADGVQTVVLAGLCSGALLSFDAALVHPEVRAIVSINGRFDAVFSDRRRDRGRRASGNTRRFLGAPLRKTPLLPYLDKVPFWVWESLARARLVASPVEAPERALARDVAVALAFGPDEWGLRALRRRGGKRFRKVAEDPMTTVVEIPRLDHSMFDPDARAEALGFVLRYLATIGPPVRALVPTTS